MGCIESQTAHSPIRISYSKPSKSPRHITRLSSKFNITEVRVVSKDERRAGYKPAYACPICFTYFNKILACSECSNFICFSCFLLYEKKAKQNLKCSFCSSSTSLFIDHELEAHSYFDTTNNGFISKEERKKIDQEINGCSNNKPQLDAIRQEEIH